MSYVESSIEVYVNQPSSITSDSDLSTLTVYATSPASMQSQDEASITVGINNYMFVAPTIEEQSLTVGVNNYTTVASIVEEQSLTVATTSPTPSLLYETLELIVGLTSTPSRSTYTEKSLTVGITGLINTNYIETPITIYLTGQGPGNYAESSLIVVKYDTKYGDIRFTYPKASNQPLGFEVVVYKALNNIYDPSDQASYLTPLREVKIGTHITENSTHYVYKSAWTPKAIDLSYPFKIAVRSVFFSGKSEWTVSGEHDI
jgi:hypothetical protein